MIVNEEELREVLRQPAVNYAMQIRCEAQGHDWEHGLTPWFYPVLTCKWCEKRKGG